MNCNPPGFCPWNSPGKILEWGTIFSSRRASVHFSSLAQLCLMLCDPTEHSMPGLPVHYQLPKFTQTHVHWVIGAIQPIQPFHPLLSPSPPAFNLSPNQGLFKWVSSLNQVAKYWEFHLQLPEVHWLLIVSLGSWSTHIIQYSNLCQSLNWPLYSLPPCTQ